MKTRIVGTLFKLAGFATAIASLVPAAKQVHFREHFVDDYPANASIPWVKALFIALIGLAVAYLFFRIGSHLQSKQPRSDNAP